MPPANNQAMLAKRFVMSAYGTLAEVFGSSAIVIVLVIVLVIFFLLRREDLRDRFIYLVGRNRVTLTTQTMQDAARRVSRSLIRRLCERLPCVQLLIGLWDAQRDLSQAKERIGGKVIVVGNMADAISQIQIHACAISPNP